MTVNSVNDGPSGTDATLTVEKDGVYTFRLDDFEFTDVNDTPEDDPSRVRITTLPSLGTISLSGSPVSAGQYILVEAIINEDLTYTPAA